MGPGEGGGHVAHILKINADRVLVVKPVQGPLGNPIRNWKDNIKMV